MADDPERILADLRRRIAAEGLPKLSAEALRAAKLDKCRLRPVQAVTAEPLTLSAEARRLFQQKNDPHWPWRKK